MEEMEENLAPETVEMVVLDGDRPQQTNPLKAAAAGDRIRMDHSSHQEDLNGRMTVPLWAGDLTMDGRTCPYPILEPEDPQAQAAACHQDQG